jgi:hypothetical protein
MKQMYLDRLVGRAIYGHCGVGDRPLDRLEPTRPDLD